MRGDALLSDRPGQLGDLARKAVDEGARLVVAVGGDGTVNEITQGLAGREGVELAVIPRGTGWDFVRTYGIPRRLEDAVAVARNGHAREIDLGRARYRSWAGGEGESLFANIASAGMSGAIAKRTNETSKALGGKVSYAWATLAVFARWRNDEVRVRVDDESRSARMHDVVVANGRFFGGGMMICPEAEPDDGLFDVLLIGDLTKRDLLLHPAEDLPRAASPAPESGGTSRLDRRGGRRRAAARRARRRAARHDAGPLRDRPAGVAAAGALGALRRRRAFRRRLLRGGRALRRCPLRRRPLRGAGRRAA